MLTTTPGTSIPAGMSPETYHELVELHGHLKSVIQTAIQAGPEGVVVVSTVIKGSGHDAIAGFSTLFECRVFGGRCGGIKSSVDTEGFARNGMRTAILDHNRMIERVLNSYLPSKATA